MKIAVDPQYSLNTRVEEHVVQRRPVGAHTLWSLFIDFSLIECSSALNGGIDFDSESIHQKLRSEQDRNKSK